MKKVYLVHCWDGNIKDGWYPWIKNHLENNEIQVIMKNMPDTECPRISNWVSKLDSMVDCLDEETYFIGHSIGCQTIMRYFEKKKDITKIGGILFVAPWLDLLPDELDEESKNIAYDWINTPIDFEKIKEFTSNITTIFSDDDYFVDINQEKVFKEKLNAKTIIVENKGHISKDDDIYELPQILMELGSLMNLELLDVVDLSGNKTGQIIDKNLVHDKNLLHNEIAVFMFNKKGEILMQKRSPNKRFNPNKWGLCAGHIDAYETERQACVREVKEEIGIDIKEEDLFETDKVLKQRKTNSHITCAYYMFIDLDIRDCVVEESEVSELKWIDFKEFRSKIENNDTSIVFENNKENMELFDKLEAAIIQNK